MEQVYQKRICGVCKAEKGSSFCKSCDKETQNIFTVGISETIRTRTSVRGKLYRKGIKKFLSDFISGWFSSGDRKLPDGVDKSRIIDHGENEYHEIVKNYSTGETIHEVHEPLSKHKK